MARLTRKFLTALHIEDENVQEQIISAHVEATDALKEQRDEYKEKADRLEVVEKELDEYKAKDTGENPLESQYEELKQTFENYKAEVEKKALNDKKEKAYRELLKKGSIPEKYHNSIVKMTNFDDIELDEKDNIKGVEKYENEIKDSYGELAVSTSQKGATVETPPVDTESVKTKDEIMKIKDTSVRQAELAKFIENERNNN